VRWRFLKIGRGDEWELTGNDGNELKSVFNGQVVPQMRSDTYGPYPLPSKNTCGFPRSAGSRWSRPADLPGTYYPDPTKKSATRRRKNFPEQQHCKYQTRGPGVNAVLLQFLRRSYADPRRIPGHTYGHANRNVSFPKPSLQREGYLFLINSAIASSS
jgi:hypothetical protein